MRLLPYSIDDNAIITWAGEPALHELAIGPALAALADPRLAAARDEFEQARHELCLDELDDAANDAGCAIESTMAALLHAHGRRQPTKHGKERVQAGPLFDALEAAGLLDRERNRHLIFAPIAVRDPGSHGAGVKPRRSDPAYVNGGIGRGSRRHRIPRLQAPVSVPATTATAALTGVISARRRKPDLTRDRQSG